MTNIGTMIKFEIENPTLPTELIIPDESKITLEILAGKLLLVTKKIIQGENTIFHASIRAIQAGD
jgi:hypothetical protein